MITLEFNVEKQQLTRTDSENVVSNASFFHKCHFTFSQDWNDKEISATFTRDGITKTVLLDDTDSCYIPPKLLKSTSDTELKIGVFGVGDGEVITSTFVNVPVVVGSSTGGASLEIANLFEQIMQKIIEVKKGEVEAELIAEAIEEYIEEHPFEPIIEDDVVAYILEHKAEFKGDKGDKGDSVGVTLQTFGAIGDGETDDTQALIDAIASEETELYITSGTYKITSPIVINRNLSIKMDVNARLLYAPSDRTDYFIYISGADETDNVQVNIEGGEIFVDFNAFVGLCFGYARMCYIKNVIISYVRIGIQTKYGDAYGGNIMVDHCDINNGTTSLTNTIGINDIGADNVFTNCATVNFETGCFTRSGKFTNFHPWLRRDTLWETSTFAKIEYSGSTFIDCVQDSMRYGFVPNNEEANCSVSNYRVINNFNLISASKLIQFPICIVKNDEIDFYPLLNNITNSITEDGVEVTLYKRVPNILKSDLQQSAQGLAGDMLNKPIDPYKGDWKKITKSDNWYNLNTGIYVVDTTVGEGGSGWIGDKIGTLFVYRSGVGTEDATALYIFMSYTDLTLYIRQRDGSSGWRPWVKTSSLTPTS